MGDEPVEGGTERQRKYRSDGELPRIDFDEAILLDVEDEIIIEVSDTQREATDPYRSPPRCLRTQIVGAKFLRGELDDAIARWEGRLPESRHRFAPGGGEGQQQRMADEQLKVKRQRWDAFGPDGQTVSLYFDKATANFIGGDIALSLVDIQRHPSDPDKTPVRYLVTQLKGAQALRAALDEAIVRWEERASTT